MKRAPLGGAQSFVSLPRRSATGTVEVAAAAQSWERLGAPVRVTWFPSSPIPVAVVEPRPSAPLAPASPIRLTFSEPVSDVLGTDHPVLSR